MIRGEIARHLDQDPHFHWRGESVTRVENLSDIVFAIALGMLVSASTPPTTYTELLAHLVGIVPVIAGFAVMVSIWNAHFVYFRRYGLADSWIVFLNCALLLFVLFMAYPLRFVFDSLFSFVIGSITDDWSRSIETGMTYGPSGITMGLFAAAYCIISSLIALMYSHALRKADVLGLSPAEITLTKRSVWGFWAAVGVGLLVFVTAPFTPIGPFAGAFMGLQWPVAALIQRALPIDDTEEKTSTPA